MAEYRDPEKETPMSSPASTVELSSSLALEKELHVKNSSNSRHERRGSSLSDDDVLPSHRHSVSSLNSITSDPLAPLERALTPDLRTPAEQQLTPTRTATSIGTNGGRHPDFEIDFLPADPDNPRNWPLWYRGLTIVTVSYATWTTVFYSTSYTSSMPGMMKDFGIDNEPLTTLGVTFYLLGLAAGSLLLAPASEIWGRRPVYVVSLFSFCVLVIPCALATSLPEVIVVRFFGACLGAAMIANAPGTVADISDETHRALAFSIWSIGPMNGPVTGPLIGGFAYQYLGWRWTNWLVLIFGGFAFITMSLIKETYAPAILKRKASQRRLETGDDRWWCRYDQHISITQIIRLNLSRPFVMIVTEPILWFWDLYISVIYGILYLCFVAYPIIFSGLRGWSPGISGLAFCGIGLGTMLAICSEPLIRRMIHAHKPDPETGKIPPEAAVSAVCIAAVLAPVGQLIFAWTSAPASIHWIWSILAGIPFGAGNSLVFIYSTNYIAGSYGIYAASALAGNAVVRSLIGGTLPLAGPAMYERLTPQWAGTLLGALEVVLIPIPFVFYKWGKQIRQRSPLIKQMREDQEKIERRTKRQARRVAQADVEKDGLEGPEADVEVEVEGVRADIVEKS